MKELSSIDPFLTDRTCIQISFNNHYPLHICTIVSNWEDGSFVVKVPIIGKTSVNKGKQNLMFGRVVHIYLEIIDTRTFGGISINHIQSIFITRQLATQKSSFMICRNLNSLNMHSIKGKVTNSRSGSVTTAQDQTLQERDM